MRFRIWLFASSAAALAVAGLLVVRSEAGSMAIGRMNSSLFQAAPPNAAVEGGERSGLEPGELPPGYEIDGVAADELLAELEVPPVGGAEWAGEAAEEEAEAEQQVIRPSIDPFVFEPPARPSQQGLLEEALQQVERMQARIEALEGSLAELQADREAQADQIAELEDELEGLNRREEFLEENRAARIDRLEAGMEGILELDELLAQGQGNLDQDLGLIAQDLAGAASDASRYAGEEEARLAAEAQASVQAAREALGRSDLYNARVHLRRAMVTAQQARVAAEAGTQALIPE